MVFDESVNDVFRMCGKSMSTLLAYQYVVVSTNKINTPRQYAIYYEHWMQMAVSDFVEQVDTTFDETIPLQQGAHNTLYRDFVLTGKMLSGGTRCKHCRVFFAFRVGGETELLFDTMLFDNCIF